MNLTKKKKIILGSAIAGVVVLLIAGGVIAAIVINNNNQAQNVMGTNITGFRNFRGGAMGAGGNFAQFRMIEGKIVTLNATDLIVDQSSGQALVGWDTNTQFRKVATADKATVLAVGNTVTLRFKTDNSVNKVTSVSLFDQTLAPATNNTSADGSQPTTMMFQGNFGGGRQGAGGDSTRERIGFGKVDSIDGNTLTLVGNDPNTKTTYDITDATFTKVEKSSASDLAVGQTVQVNGGNATGKVTARMITIQ